MLQARMPDETEIRILLPTDAESIAAFARSKIKATDPMELEMAGWTARWRPESLAHYLPKGWSFGAFDAAGGARGFVLGQPLLFYRGLTQTLWIEDLVYDDVAVAHALIDVTYRWSRDKHLQCVLLEARDDLQFVLNDYASARLSGGLVEIRTAKF